MPRRENSPDCDGIPHQKRNELPSEAVELTAARLRVLADPNRITLIEALNHGEASVQELADLMAVDHQRVSRHLAQLHLAGMVSRRREGSTIRYRLIDWSGWWVIEQIARWVQEGLDQD
jgi:DNA-binding transcriptional ArsR family regulator